MPFVLVFFFYAVVNLRFPNISRGLNESFKLKGFIRARTLTGGGLKWLFVICSAYASQVVAPFLPNRLRDFGGLKWTFANCFASLNKWSPHFCPIACAILVGSNGLEPSTSRLSGVCSNQLSYEPIFFNLKDFGGGKRDRTADPLLAGQVLYQLSYAPIGFF